MTEQIKTLPSLETGQVEITVSPDDNNKVSFQARSGRPPARSISSDDMNKVSFQAEAREISIDWGDGVIDAFTPNGESRDFEHVYPDRKPRTIKINTEGLVRFGESVGEVFGGQGKTWKGEFHTLRFGDCPELKNIFCPGLGLTRLEINRAESLTELICPFNKLTALDVSNCTALIGLACPFNNLTVLDASNCTALTGLACLYNKLTVLDVSNCTALTGVDCRFNKLTTLDVRGCTALTWLNCEENKLTTLDASECTALTHLDCHSNHLTALDVSNCTALIELDCRGNWLETPALNHLFANLPARRSYDIVRCLKCSFNPDPDNNYSEGRIHKKFKWSCNVSIAYKKGWIVQ